MVLFHGKEGGGDYYQANNKELQFQTRYRLIILQKKVPLFTKIFARRLCSIDAFLEGLNQSFSTWPTKNVEVP